MGMLRMRTFPLVEILVTVELLLSGVRAHAVHALWKFAVTTESEIVLYNAQLQQIGKVAQQYAPLSAVVYDGSREALYFSGKTSTGSGIYSLKVPSEEAATPAVRLEVEVQGNGSVTSLAYDAMDERLYWSDRGQQRIYTAALHAAENLTQSQVFLDLTAEGALPDGVAVDSCRRRLYWTNSNFKNASVESIALNGSERRLVAQEGLFLPRGIVVDQTTARVYWVVDQEGVHFSVESAQLDGGDRIVVLQSINHEPLNLAVTTNAVLWTDRANNAIWGYDPTQLTETPALRKLSTLGEHPRGIVTRTEFYAKVPHEHCWWLVEEVRKRALAHGATPNGASQSAQSYSLCLHGGDYSDQNDMCVCPVGYLGAHCELNECHNYCLNGECSLSVDGRPICDCVQGFEGVRCELPKCADYCLNGGVCRAADEGDPICDCPAPFDGVRCEQNQTEHCTVYCHLYQYEALIALPPACAEFCAEPLIVTLAEEQPPQCHTGFSTSAILILAAGAVVAVCLAALIAHTLCGCKRLARPIIKKTFVVRRHTTPRHVKFTNEPLTTHECEITIENCCNMTVCDTPCFDPKALRDYLPPGEDESTVNDKMSPICPGV